MTRRKPHSSALVLLIVLIFGFWWGISVMSANLKKGNNSFAPTQTAFAAYSEKNPLKVEFERTDTEVTYHGTYHLGPCESIGEGISYNSNPARVQLVFVGSPKTPSCNSTEKTEPISFELAVSLPEASESYAFDGVVFNGNTVPTVLTEAK